MRMMIDMDKIVQLQDCCKDWLLLHIIITIISVSWVSAQSAIEMQKQSLQ